MKRFVFLVLVGFLLAGCSLEYPSSDSVDVSRGPGGFSMSEAKELFERSVTGMESAPDGYLSPGDFTPQWSDARYTAVEGGEYYDAPIIPTYRYEVLNSSFVRGRSVVRRDDVCQRLVVMKKSETSSGVYIASLIPASDNKTSLSVLRPCKLEGTGYSGMLVYSDVSSGSMVRVNVYESGRKVYGAYVPVVKSYSDLYSALNERLEALSLYRHRSLLTKYDGGEIDPSYCYPEPEPEPDPDPPYESPYEEEEPPEDPEPGEDDYTGEEQEPVNQGTTSGTTTPVDPPIVNSLGTPYSPKPTDRLFRSSFPKTMSQTQLPGWCTFAIMSYISDILGADYNQGDYALLYSQMTGTKIEELIKGVDSSQLVDFINACFNSSNCNGREEIANALDSGKVVFSYILLPNYDGHALCIVGYAADGTFIYMDPEIGTLYNENAGNLLNIVNGYAISGYKEI